MQRTFIISIIALAILGLGVGVYFYFFSTKNIGTTTQIDVNLPLAGQGTSPSNKTPKYPTAQDTPTATRERLVKISAGPVVPGEAVINMKARNASSSPDVMVNYIEKQSGNVFSYNATTSITTRISNKTVPGIQSASWLPNASAAFVQYLSGTDFSTINTYALSATTSDGFFLPQNIATVSASSVSILTLVSGPNGSVGSLMSTNGSHAVRIFTTPLSSLRASFAGKNQYLAFSKPASSIAGYAFLINTAGHFSRVAGPRDGLVALASPSGAWVLVSYVQGNNMHTELINSSLGTSIALPIATIADKCVWAADDSSIYCGVPTNPDGAFVYPDDWYQGAAHFSDQIWKINVASRYAERTLDFSQAQSGDLDAEALALDPALSTLVFVNKNDGSLWSYRL
ncbi:MAG: hypothetical protein WAW90_02075 [Minisyncoccia bacterium]